MRWVSICILCLLALIALIIKFPINIPRVMNSFDGSSAGEKAIKKSKAICLAVRVVLLGGYDLHSVYPLAFL